ncbi:MAG: CPBP family intramembrane metalloprotease [Thermoplasmatales archaeon]|nr:CPBP family intramembrane metalloprotease [Thermoplasmatales archaeon]
MDFNVNKPSHIFAFLLLMISILFIFILPIVTFIVFYDTDYLSGITIDEFSAIISQMIVIGVFIIVPFMWYLLVNRLKFKGILSRIRLVSENIDMAFLWGILAAIIIFAIIFVIELGLIALGHKPEDLSNIPNLQALFSPAVMFFLVAIQPIGEEIFFRGFLYEKIEKFSGPMLSIVITSILFGVAHMSYAKWFPALMPILMGFVLGLYCL